MIRFLFVLLLTLHTGYALAQTKKFDSLKAVLAKHPQADTFRVNRLNELLIEGFDQLPPANLIELDSLANVSFRLATTCNYRRGQAYALYAWAGAKYWAGQRTQYYHLVQKAIALFHQLANKNQELTILLDVSQGAHGHQQRLYFQQAIEAARAMNNPDSLFFAYSSIINACQDNYPLALQYALPLLATVEKDTNRTHRFKTLQQLARLYTGLKEYDRALIYLKQMQPLGKQLRHWEYQVLTLVALGELYYRKEEPDSAIRLYNRALTYGRNDNEWVAEINARLAQCYVKKRLNRQVITYARQSLSAIRVQKGRLRKRDYIGYQALAWQPLSQAYLNSEQLDSALYYAKECLDYYRSFTLQVGDIESMRNTTHILSLIYARKKDYSKAYEYQSQYISYKDSLNNEDVTRRATAAQFAQQMNRQRSQIALLQKDKQLQTEESKRQRLLLYTSLIVLVLIGGLLALVYRNNRQKQNANALLAQQRDQINQTLTNLEATQNQLIQKEKMASLGELTAGIAHEIQNPLNFVNNFSEVSTEMVEELADESQKPQRDSSLEEDLLADLKANLQKINHHGQRASNIVRGMLEHSRSATGDVQATNLNGLAEEYLRLAYHGQRAKDKEVNCELVTDFDATVGQVAVMSQEVGRVFLNLFSNAFYAVHARQQQGGAGYQPTVWVSTRRVAKGVEIRVRDNGVGMAQGVQQKIFQPFFTTKPVGQGTGLGLSLSYDIITKGHGGTLSVVSQEGEGTEFIITIPA